MKTETLYTLHDGMVIGCVNLTELIGEWNEFLQHVLSVIFQSCNFVSIFASCIFHPAASHTLPVFSLIFSCFPSFIGRHAAGVWMLCCLNSYSPALLELTRSMLSVDPSSRPDISQVISQLHQLLSESFTDSRVCWPCLTFIPFV